MRQLDTIVVHCSATEEGTVEGIRKYHKSLGWQDIGYHFVIYKNGSKHPGRPIEIAGSHVKGANAKTVGVCLIGLHNFKIVQIQTLKSLINDLKIKYPKIKYVRPHHWYPSAKAQGKTCPNEQDWPESAKFDL